MVVIKPTKARYVDGDSAVFTNYPEEDDKLTLNDELQAAIEDVLEKFRMKADIKIEVFDGTAFGDPYDITIRLDDVRK